MSLPVPTHAQAAAMSSSSARPSTCRHVQNAATAGGTRCPAATVPRTPTQTASPAPGVHRQGEHSRPPAKASEPPSTTHQAARRQAPTHDRAKPLHWLVRSGFVARSLTYGIIGALALALALVPEVVRRPTSRERWNSSPGHRSARSPSSRSLSGCWPTHCGSSPSAQLA